MWVRSAAMSRSAPRVPRASAHQEGGEQHRQRRHDQPAGEAGQHLRGDVAGPLRVRVGEVRAAELQPGEVAHRLAVPLHRLLDEGLVGERLRIAVSRVAICRPAPGRAAIAWSARRSLRARRGRRVAGARRK
jgi:hypothetical protein